MTHVLEPHTFEQLLNNYTEVVKQETVRQLELNGTNQGVIKVSSLLAAELYSAYQLAFNTRLAVQQGVNSVNLNTLPKQ